MYLIYSHEHGAWWKPGRWGYTGKLSEAGTYGLREARQICERANVLFSRGIGDLPNEVLIDWTDDEDQASFDIQAATGSLLAARAR